MTSTGLALAFAGMSIFVGCDSPPRPYNSTNVNSGAASPVRSGIPVAHAGSSVLERDAVGDVLDGDYRKPRQKLPGIDLASVKIESSGSDMTVTFTATSDFPYSLGADQSAVWHINACTPDGNHCCWFGAKVMG